jgi:hypothetical protein
MKGCHMYLFPYAPDISSLELPFVTSVYACVADKPFTLSRVLGKTPGTLLYGAFSDALFAQDKSAAARLLKGSPDFEPGWTFSPRAIVNAPTLWQHAPVSKFHLQVRLFGRTAVKEAGIVERAVLRMGTTGLDIKKSNSIHFTVVDKKVVRQGTPMTVASTMTGIKSMPFSFVTPVIIRDTVSDDQGERRRMFQAGGEVALDSLLGNLAYDMCYLDLHERGATDLTMEQAKVLANASRDAVKNAASYIAVDNVDQYAEDYGVRASKTQHGKYEMRGFTARLHLSGKLDAALPWIVALTAWRGGQLASKGFGWAEMG